MQPQPLPPILRSESFSTRAARQAGVSGERLRRSDLTAPFRGVRVPTEKVPTTVVEKCRAYRLLLPAGGLFSHGTAAQLLGLPVPARIRDDPLINVAVPRPARAPRMRGVRGHQLATLPAMSLVRGLPVPEPAELWCQLGRILTIDELVVIGDALSQRSNPLTSPAELRDALENATARPGIRALRSAVELVRARTDSPMESRLRLAIVRDGLPEPLVNYIIAGPERGYHLDLAYPHRRLAVEYDGDQHRTDPDQYRLDVDRHWRIQSLGWRIVRINSAHMVAGAHEAIRRVRLALATN